MGLTNEVQAVLEGKDRLSTKQRTQLLALTGRASLAWPDKVEGNLQAQEGGATIAQTDDGSRNHSRTGKP